MHNKLIIVTCYMQGTHNVINLDDYSSDIDHNSTTKNIKKKKRSMAPTPTNAIIDIEDDLDDPSNLDFQISRHQFPRPEYMNLNDDQIDVAYYIFSRGLQTDEVITSLAYHLNLEQQFFIDNKIASPACFLPATLQKLVLEHEWIPDKVDEYQNSFLRSAINCRKVYLPMNDNNEHWYLTVILMDKMEVHVVDSKPSKIRDGIRLKAVQNMVNFMGDVFKVLYLKRGIDKPVPDVAKFKIIIPPSVPRQDNTYDCGIWVTKWMEYHESLFDDYIHVVRNNLDRMHLAIKLVMGPHNQILEHILGQVEQHAIIRKRAINWYLDGKDTAEDGMRYSDNWRARRFLEFGI
ncbi:hypothetical protein LINPERPRIM_LOCUS615 [Linum perenne]